MKFGYKPDANERSEGLPHVVYPHSSCKCKDGHGDALNFVSDEGKDVVPFTMGLGLRSYGASERRCAGYMDSLSFATQGVDGVRLYRVNASGVLRKGCKVYVNRLSEQTTLQIVYASCGKMVVLRHYRRMLYMRGHRTPMVEVTFAYGIS